MLTDLLFVYGTLKRGAHNHALLSQAEYLGEARTERAYRLLDCGPYPALLEHATEPLEINGELYRISEAMLPTLDDLEDEGTLYRRITATITPIANAEMSSPVTAWTYLWLGGADAYPLVSGPTWLIK